MLNGIAPIFIFSFFKNLPPTIVDGKASTGIVSVDVTQFPLPPIPLYLDENLTGIVFDSENKNIDAETTVDTLTSGDTARINQTAINSTVTINLSARKDSIGLSIISAMMDIIYQLLTSREYQITYLNGTTTIFFGLLHSYAINQATDSELATITITLIKNTNNTAKKDALPKLANKTAETPLT
jgi:hypothetical protein